MFDYFVAQAGGVGANSYTFSLDNGPSTLMVAIVSQETSDANGAATLTAKHNAVSLTPWGNTLLQVDVAGNFMTSQAFRLESPYTGGAADFVAGSDIAQVGGGFQVVVFGFSAHHPTGYEHAQATDTAPSADTVVSANPGVTEECVLLDYVAVDGNAASYAPDSGQTELHDAQAANHSAASGFEGPISSGEAHQWTVSGASYAGILTVLAVRLSEVIHPNAVTAQSGTWSGAATDIDEWVSAAVDAASSVIFLDGALRWTATDGGQDKVDFETPAVTPSTAANAHTVRICVTKVTSAGAEDAGGGVPTYDLVYGDAGGETTLATGVSVSGLSQIDTYTATYGGSGDGSDIYLKCTSHAGGGGPNEREAAIEAVEIVIAEAAAGSNLVKVIDEGEGIADAQLSPLGLNRFSDEGVSVGDAHLAPLGLARLADESMSVAESLLRALGLVRSTDEGATVTEGTPWARGQFRVIDETGQVSEVLVRTLGKAVVRDEGVAVNEGDFQTSIAWLRIVDEAVQAGESVPSAMGLARAVAESEGVSESYLTALALLRIRDEGATVQETRLRARGLARVQDDGAVQVSESLLRLLGLVESASEGVVTAEAIASALGRAVVWDEATTVTETTANQLSLGRVVNEAVSIAESLARAMGLGRLVNEGMGATESVERPGAWLRIVDETAQVSESTTPARTITRIVTEAMSIVENVLSTILAYVLPRARPGASSTRSVFARRSRTRSRITRSDTEG